MAGNQAVKIEHIKKEFLIDEERLEVLSDIAVSIEGGEFVSIVGASGCGKSTLLRIIAGLERATEGTVYIGECPVERPTIATGMIFQESRLFPWLSVEDNIAFGIHEKMPAAEKRKLIQNYIELVRLQSFEKALPKQLSGGMQQRVSIARTLINQPEVLLLDEPFGALDALTKIQMQNEVLRIWEEKQTTMVLVTHDIDEAIFLSDKIIIMSERPGIVKKVIPVNITRKRDRSSYEFMKIRREIYSEFFDDTNIEVEYYL